MKNAGLSKLDRAVLEALGRGLSAAEAATELGLSLDEVRASLRHSMQVLEARTKLEALLRASREGLIDLQP